MARQRRGCKAAGPRPGRASRMKSPQPPRSRGSGEGQGGSARRLLAETGLLWAAPATRPLFGAGSVRAPSAIREGAEPAHPALERGRRGRGVGPSRGLGAAWPGSGCSPGAPLRAAGRGSGSSRKRPGMSRAGGLKNRACVCAGETLQRPPDPLPPPRGSASLLVGARRPVPPAPGCILLPFFGVRERASPGAGGVPRGWGCPPGRWVQPPVRQ